MNIPLFLLAIFLLFTGGFIVGYYVTIFHHKIVPVENVKKYIDQNLPNEWEAYQKGVRDGFRQAHQNDDHDEPA